MYGFTDDKSQWNLGSWNYITLNSSGWKAGIESDDSDIATKYADKWIYEHTPQTPYFTHMLGEVGNPAIIWDVVGTVYGMTPMLELQQEIYSEIEDVFFQNQKIYVVANSRINLGCNLRVKGA